MSPTFYSENDYWLYHHGILGMKWGVRRYQNKDGSLTTAGRKRLGFKTNTKHKLSDKQKKAIIIGAVAVGSILAIYGGMKIHKAAKYVDVKSALNAKKMASQASKFTTSPKTESFKYESFKPDSFKTTSSMDKEADDILKEFNSRHVKNATQNGADSFRKASQDVDDLTEEFLKRSKRS